MPDTAANTRNPPGLRRLNDAELADLRARLNDCLAVRRWIDLIANARPYADVAALLAQAERATASIGIAEILAAIEHHPRIGRLAGPDSTTGAWSASEQSGVDLADTALTAELRAANQDYERRFEHIYLVCATGMSGQQMLSDLRARLSNEPAAELRLIRTHLGEIAKLRLKKVIDS